MLKKRRLFSDESLAKFRKPQYKVLDVIKPKAIQELTAWFNNEFELPGCDSRLLAEEVIERVVAEKQQAIHPTAPDVFVSEKTALESVLMDAQKTANSMDEAGELEDILERNAAREEREKYGV